MVYSDVSDFSDNFTNNFKEMARLGGQVLSISGYCAITG